MRKKTAFALLGPTASGKSRLALRLALEFASPHPIEIVSIDSAQVYRGMDIGTAKPSAAERRAVPHHLLDLVDPTEAYSAGRFREDAIRAIADIHARGRTALLVGGTMLYYRSLAQGLDALPPADPGTRARIDRVAAEQGWPALHAELAKVDPASAARIDPGDAQRLQRAHEVWQLTKKPISELQVGSAGELPFDLRAFALAPNDRAELHRCIAERFDAMLKADLVEELRALRKRFDLNAQLPSMRAVGYRQAWRFLEKRIGAKELRETGAAATRQLAKRQMTWLRSLPGIEPASGLADALRIATRA